MDWFNAILQAITTVGFPIVMCGWLLWDKKNTTDSLAKVIEANTRAIDKMSTKIDRLEKKE